MASSTSWVIMNTVGLAGFFPDFHQFVLDHTTSERIQRAERLVQQQEFRLGGEGPGDTHPLTHAAR
ncbi:hypothetical protein MSSD14B_32890 [Marinobacter salsuginis]|uniref:Uncharacterized protein n=1 Tax=Marinobacter salsuginis TaxID=418719 RepID=A0A5M3Q3N3_9GAMM|nr:hypothetical protein MSSD14B_32890 [Marinobacter salsuginis]